MADVSAPFHAADHAADRAGKAEAGPRWTRVGAFFDQLNGVLSYAKGLPVITLIGSLLVGYFQYLSTYQDKVSAQAKEDLGAATATFSDIANAFSEAQTLQQLLYFDYAAALDENADGDAQALPTKNAQATYPLYERARTALRQNSDLLARKAEIYIDWASDFDRDPADAKTPSTDPLNQSLLGVYQFDCDNPANIPHFEIAGSGRGNTPSTNGSCPVGLDQGNRDPSNTYVNLCARHDGQPVLDKPAVTIHWYSAKHEVLTMHYCLERLHTRLLAARDWASQSVLSPERKAQFVAERAETRAALDNQAIRLNAFMSLAMFQIENIHVKYRPLGFACHVPFVTPFLDLFSNYCTPVRTAPVRRAEDEARQSS